LPNGWRAFEILENLEVFQLARPEFQRLAHLWVALAAPFQIPQEQTTAGLLVIEVWDLLPQVVRF
jgi:hypothetical protein